jgi:hypothetical protein
MIAQIDAFRRDEVDIPTRPEMIRRMLLDWLEKKGKSEGQIGRPRVDAKAATDPADGLI